MVNRYKDCIDEHADLAEHGWTALGAVCTTGQTSQAICSQGTSRLHVATMNPQLLQSRRIRLQAQRTTATMMPSSLIATQANQQRTVIGSSVPSGSFVTQPTALPRHSALHNWQCLLCTAIRRNESHEAGKTLPSAPRKIS